VSADQRHALKHQLCSLVKDNVGISVECDVVEPGTLTRSEGKAVRVVDLR